MNGIAEESLVFMPVPDTTPPQWELLVTSPGLGLHDAPAYMRTEQGIRTIRFDVADLRRLLKATYTALGQ